MSEDRSVSPQSVVDVVLGDQVVEPRHPHVELERVVAVRDFVEENYVVPVEGPPGPYVLHLRLEGGRAIVAVYTLDEVMVAEQPVRLSGFRRVINDYFLACEDWFRLEDKSNKEKYEIIDSARRKFHDEGSLKLIAKLAKRIDIDMNTAKRLFTLICVLHMRGSISELE